MTQFHVRIAIGIALLIIAGSKSSAQNPNNPPVLPIVELRESCLIGGVQNHKWLNADRFAKSVRLKQPLKRFTLAGPAGDIRLSKVGQSDCFGEWEVEHTTDAAEGIAIESPTWDVMPRMPRPIDPKDTTYLTVIADILKRSGISRPEVKIQEGYKVDLDGDGRDEVVIIASRFEKGIGELSGVSHGSYPGDYTIVLVRTVINEKAENLFLIKDIRLKENEGPLVRGYHLSAIADLNGDGVMEIVLYGAYHEGSSSSVIQIKGSKAKWVLDCSCEH